MLEGIKDFLFSIKLFFLDIKNGIYNLWYWKKTIWRTRWYDYGFLADIMKKQLILMRDNWDKSHYIGSEKEKKILEEAVKILEELEECPDNEGELWEKFGDLLFKVKEYKTTDNRIAKHAGIERLWD